MGLLGLYMGKVTRVRKKLVGSAVFLKLVRPLVFSDPACAENRVIRDGKFHNGIFVELHETYHSAKLHETSMTLQ